MKYLLHPFSSSPFGLQSTSPSQRQLRGIQRLPHENSSAEQLILSKNNKQKFDDLLNRHFSKQKIDKISQLENVLGEDRFLMYYKFKNYQCERVELSNTRTDYNKHIF